MPVVALASLIATQGAVTLQYQPKVGSTYNFGISSTIQNQSGTANITADSTVKILSHTGAYYRVETVLSNIKNGGKAANFKKTPTILDYDKYGSVKLDQKSSNSGSAQLMGSFNNQALGMQFPKTPVKVGSTWTNSVNLGAIFTTLMKKPGSKATGKVNLVFKLVQISSKAAVVACTMRGSVAMESQTPVKGKSHVLTKATMSLTGTGQYTVERSSGVYLASNMTMQIVNSVAGRSFSSTQSVSMKRL